MLMETVIVGVVLLAVFVVCAVLIIRRDKRKAAQLDEYRKDPRYAAGQAAARDKTGYFQSKQGSIPFRLGYEEEKAVIAEEERAAHRAWCKEHGDYDD